MRSWSRPAAGGTSRHGPGRPPPCFLCDSTRIPQPIRAGLPRNPAGCPCAQRRSSAPAPRRRPVSAGPPSRRGPPCAANTVSVIDSAIMCNLNPMQRARLLRCTNRATTAGLCAAPAPRPQPPLLLTSRPPRWFWGGPRRARARGHVGRSPALGAALGAAWEPQCVGRLAARVKVLQDGMDMPPQAAPKQHESLRIRFRCPTAKTRPGLLGGPCALRRLVGDASFWRSALRASHRRTLIALLRACKDGRKDRRGRHITSVESASTPQPRNRLLLSSIAARRRLPHLSIPGHTRRLLVYHRFHAVPS